MVAIPVVRAKEGLYRDGAAFLRYACLSKPARIYLFGFSLGASVALRIAADQPADCPVDGVVTLGAFSSLGSVAPKWVRGLLPDRFDNIATVRRLRTPFLLMHGPTDNTIPFAEAAKLERASAVSPRVVVLRGAAHDIALDAVAPSIWNNILQMTHATTALPLSR